MNKITIAIVLGIAVVGATVRADTKTTYRDSMGRIQGTVTTDRYGKTKPRMRGKLAKGGQSLKF